MADYDAKLTDVPKHEWREIPSDRKRSAKVPCPKCDEWLTLYEHDILSDGRVIPSVSCACGFHGDIRLEGWQ